jgi:FMN-dependent oxidoreductase (nitrilotriacetate monooxygenase family)
VIVLSIRQLHLNVNSNGLGRNVGGWRVAEQPLGFLDLDAWEQLGRIAERGLLDSVFLADVLGGGGDNNKPWNAYDPFFPLTAVARATSRVGVVATVSSSFKYPYDIARLGSSLDFASNGRAAINVVTTMSPSAAGQYGLDELPDYDTRYGRADEAITIAKLLWDSWEPGALVADKDSGVFVDTSKVHDVEFEGKHHRLKTRFQFPRSPQGRPVLLQAGASPQGIELAAKHVDAVFSAAHTLSTGQDFYRKVKSRAAAYGRSEDEILILPGLFIVLGSTETEARERRAWLDQLSTTEDNLSGLRGLSSNLGVPVESLDLDKQLPWHLIDRPGWKPRSHGFANAILAVAKQESLTVRELVERDISGHRTIVGTPEQVADSIEEWFTGRAADGFNFNFDYFPDGLEQIVDHLVPELQRRGIYRREYTASTLRGHLGLQPPATAVSEPQPVAS